jgi:hypothetical protein
MTTPTIPRCPGNIAPDNSEVPTLPPRTGQHGTANHRRGGQGALRSASHASSPSGGPASGQATTRGARLRWVCQAQTRPCPVASWINACRLMRSASSHLIASSRAANAGAKAGAAVRPAARRVPGGRCAGRRRSVADRRVDQRLELAAEVERARWQQLSHEDGNEVLGRVHPEDRRSGTAPHVLAR